MASRNQVEHSLETHHHERKPQRGTCRTKDIIRLRKWLFSGTSAKRPFVDSLKMSPELSKLETAKLASGGPTLRGGSLRAWRNGFTAVYVGPPEPKGSNSTHT